MREAPLVLGMGGLDMKIDRRRQPPDSGSRGSGAFGALSTEDRDTTTVGRFCWRVAVRVREMTYHPIVSATSEQEARDKAAEIMHADAVRGALCLHSYEWAHPTGPDIDGLKDFVMASLIQVVPVVA